MAQQKLVNTPQSNPKTEGITRITVGGFKSIAQEQSIEIRPLTILAGANSSGKSSMMQPLLLMKQTLEAPYDPGALLLNGPNVRFTSTEQLLARLNKDRSLEAFHIGIEAELGTVTVYFKKSKNKGFDLEQMTYTIGQKEATLSYDMSQEELRNVSLLAISKEALDFDDSAINFVRSFAKKDHQKFGINIILERERCFLVPIVALNNLRIARNVGSIIAGTSLREVIHLPGLRGNPERTYPVTAVETEFSGTFENYVASILGQWQADRKNDKLTNVNRDLKRLGLTGKVSAKAVNDTQVELRVNRLLRSDDGSTEDMVNIADVGLGVSQTLPVVVALHAAQSGQLIYLEQPEIHLHPRAQVAMAEVLADAAIQGKRLAVETHSSLLLLGIQTLVAEGKLPPELVKLHWFAQQEDGSTQITSADLDNTGSFGDWPEDFDDVELYSEKRYLDAAQARLRGKK